MKFPCINEQPHVLRKILKATNGCNLKEETIPVPSDSFHTSPCTHLHSTHQVTTSTNVHAIYNEIIWGAKVKTAMLTAA
jgi:hypothetical protein